MSAPTAPVLSQKAKLYYNSGTYGTPTWTLIDNVGDIEPTNAVDKTELLLRSQNGWKVYVQGLTDYGLVFKMMYDPADTKQSALRTAYYAKTSIEILVLDQAVDTAGSYGIRAAMAVFKFARGEPINGCMMVDVELAPTYSTNPPAEFTVSA